MMERNVLEIRDQACLRCYLSAHIPSMKLGVLYGNAHVTNCVTCYVAFPNHTSHSFIDIYFNLFSYFCHCYTI